MAGAEAFPRALTKPSSLSWVRLYHTKVDEVDHVLHSPRAKVAVSPGVPSWPLASVAAVSMARNMYVPR